MKKHFFIKSILTGALFLLCLTGCTQKTPQPTQSQQETAQNPQETQETAQSPQETQQAAPSGGEQIGEERAKQIALEHAGVNEADTQRLRVEFDYDDGRAEYEVEWDVGRMEYDYEIDAYTGEILSFEKELD